MRLKGLPVPVEAAVHLAAAVIFSPEAHGPPASRARPGLADQALAGVTDVEMVAGLPQPPRTYPAAVAAVQHQGHPRWASGWWPGTGTWCGAQLGTHLGEETEEGEGEEVGLKCASHVTVSPWPTLAVEWVL